MDASRLAVTFAVLMIAYGLGRFVVLSLSRAGDGMATLFVPPDRALGWPRGVQERDEPWAWRLARDPDIESGSGAGSGSDEGGGSGGPPVDALSGPVHGAFHVPVERVAPVRLVVRPH